MAWYTQEMKKALQPKVKELCKKYNIKFSISIQDHRKVCVTLKSGSLDIVGNFIENTNHHDVSGLTINSTAWIDREFSGTVNDFLSKLREVINEGNWNKSDIQTDYFNVGWYSSIVVGGRKENYFVTK